MTPSAPELLDRLRTLYAQLVAPDPVPDEAADDREWDAWMARVGADGDLAGLLQSALHGGRPNPRELQECRASSERAGSALDAQSLAEAFRLLGRL